jgi:hypothetical protein
MIKHILAAALLVAFVMPCSVFAGQDGSPSLRYRADSEFRIAEKAYRKAKDNYGDNLEGMPDKERRDACQKLEWALYDNKSRYSKEDVLTQRKYKRQVDKLETYSSELGCQN